MSIICTNFFGIFLGKILPKCVMFVATMQNIVVLPQKLC